MAKRFKCKFGTRLAKKDFKALPRPITGKYKIWPLRPFEAVKLLLKSYRGAKGIIIVYDITNAKSFEDVKKWLRSIEENSGDDVVTVIIGNKSDMESLRSVSIEDAKALAKQTKSGFLETSAKNNVNIDEAFILLASAILNKMYQPQPRGDQSEDLPTRKLSHKPSNSRRTGKKGCCWKIKKAPKIICVFSRSRIKNIPMRSRKQVNL